MLNSTAIVTRWMFVGILSFLFVMPCLCHAQNYLYEGGYPSFGTQLPVEAGSVNVANGMLHLEIPIASTPERGKVPYVAKLVYEGRIWAPPENGYGYAVELFSELGAGWYLISPGFGSAHWANQYTYDCSTPDGGYTSYTEIWGETYIDTTGTTRFFSFSDPMVFGGEACGIPDNRDATAWAADGSGYYLAVTDFQENVYTKDGTRVFPTVQDTNSNSFSFDANWNVVDPIGRTPLQVLQNGNQFTLSVLNAQGGRSNYTINTSTFPVFTNAPPSSYWFYCQCSIRGIDSVVLPDGAQYHFHYDVGNYGLMTSMDLPTGGHIDYGYTPYADITGQGNLWLTSRISNGQTWHYDPVRLNATTQQVTVTRPAGDRAIYTFSQNTPSYGLWTNQTQYFNPDGSWLMTVGKQPCPGNIFYCDVLTTSLPSGVSKKIEEHFDWPGWRRVTSTNEWQYASSFGSTPDRETDYSYWNNPYRFQVDRISDEKVIGVKGDGSWGVAAETQFQYDPAGNPTQVSRFSSSTGSWLTTTNGYDGYGNLTSTTDPGTHQRQLQWNGCSGAYPTTTIYPVTAGVGHQEFATYDCNTGLVTSTTDQNGQITNYGYDSLNRPTDTTLPGGGALHVDYIDANTIKKSTKQSATSWIVEYSRLDSYGRPYQTQVVDPEGDVFTETSYDVNGRVNCISNPHRAGSSPTDGSTCEQYDGVDRITDVIEQDGNSIHTNYSSLPTVTITDETGRPKQEVVDGLGRISRVTEPNYVSGSLASGSYPTYYGYDALNNLKSVNQVGDGSQAARNRTYVYDTLSRLLSAYNPESGTTTYEYDADGNLLYKTDARGYRLSFGYDALHRLTIEHLPDRYAAREFFYDVTPPFSYNAPDHGSSIGRLTHASNDDNAAYDPSYDAMGRIIATRYCIPSHCNWDINAGATYDLAGNLTSLTYPSGRKITEHYNVANRLINVNFDSFNSTTVNYPYFTAYQDPSGGNPGYHPTGGLRLSYFGNNVWNYENVNSRLQPIHEVSQASVPGNPYLVNRAFSYSEPNFNNGNAGDVTSIVDGLSGARNQIYAYDWLNRLSSASQADGSFNQTFSIDPWGNLKQFGTSAFSPNFDGNNRISQIGYNYDAAGNLLSDTFHAYSYDAESRISSVDTNGAIYTYDADGNRVRKDVGSDATEYIYFNGQPIAEYKPATGDWSDYIYADGKRIAKADTFENGIRIQGHNDCSGSCWPNTWFRISDANYISGYTIRSGDKLYFRQYQANARGGMGIFFQDGSNNVWQSTDQSGAYTNDDPTQNGSWNARIVDLSAFAGRVVSWIGLDNDGYGPLGNWTLIFGDIALVSSDGTVRPIYNGSANFSVSLAWASGASNAFADNRHLSNIGWATFSTTSYYHDDYLGTSHLMTSYWGWPIWQGTFMPFGQEVNPQITTNHYKFTDDEHDGESNLEHTQFRQLSATQGRWLSPDPDLASANIENPQSFNRYAYVLNNPLIYIDPDGRDCIYTTDQTSESLHLIIVRGDCLSETDSGVFVDGHVDMSSLVYNSQTGFVGFQFFNEDEKKESGSFNVDPARFDPILLAFSQNLSSLRQFKIPAAFMARNGPPKSEYCSQLSDKAALAKLIPGGDILFQHEFTSRGAAAAGIEIATDVGKDYAKDKAFETAAKGATTLGGIRKSMGLTAKDARMLGRGVNGFVAAYNAYQAIKAAQNEYADCME